MIYLSRKIASKLLKIWKKYKLSQWLSMVVGGVIFVFGYVLGTISWRRGSSGFLVVLDIVCGTAGFFYFCFKGLQIFADAHEELIALLFNEQHQIEIEHNQTVENDYVLGQTIFSHIEETNLRNKSTFCDDLENKENENHFEFKNDSRGTLDFEHYENSPASGEQYAENDERGIEERNGYSKRLYNPRSTTEIRYVSASPPEVLNERGVSENVVSAFTKTSKNSKLTSPCDELLSSQSFNTDSYKDISENSHSFESSYNYSSENGSHEHLFEQTSPVLREVHQDLIGKQRPMQGATSEIMLSSLQKELMQYYQSPRTISLSSPCLETPEPCRHLKPESKIRKPLPPLPSFEKIPNNSENMSPFSTPRNQNVPLPTYQLQPRRKYLHPCLSLPAANKSPVPVYYQSRSPVHLCQPLPLPTRGSEPLTRHKSHPVNTVWSRSPPRLPYWSKMVTPRYSHRSSWSLSTSPESPLQKRRPSPPSRGRPYSIQQYSKQNPPKIPRKVRTSR